ncbi:acyltransferase family protein [Pontibacter chitinilyticus]|uniref:acyltransferase family protein n=1 Tax=Pontibacter chitinilyticus TaxID=2674989 RepID=UPI00321B10F3
MTNTAKPKSDFRYDINALRALAILGVLLFHYKVPFFEGGFAGVDVFFVISGYLMSRIIIRSINKNAFSYKDYLEKRLQRIVPALLCLVTCLTLAGFFLYLPEDYRLNEKNAAASVLFLSNILYWQSSSYFAPSSDMNILLHTWSLSVEWQFYLLYPAALLLLHKAFKAKLPYMLCFVGSTVLLAFFAIWFTETNPTASFYLLPTRSWEMLCGGIAFFAEGYIRGYKWRKVLAIAGYVTICLSFLLLNTSMLWPGIFTLLPVVATFLVIIADHSDVTIVRHSGLQFIGRISYSLYLWHWPIYVIAQYFGIGESLWAVTAFALLSVALGYVSFKYVETFRFANSRPVIAAMVVLFVCTAGLAHFKANRALFKDKTFAIESYQSMHQQELFAQYRRDTCHVSKMEEYDEDYCLRIEEGKKNILLLGDSHLGQLSRSIIERFESRGVHILQATASGTFPTLQNYEGRKAMVRPLMDYIFRDFIPAHAGEIDGVILSASWAGKSDIPQDSILFGIQEARDYLRKYNIPTLVIGQTETYKIPYETIAARDYEYGIHSGSRFLNDYTYELDSYLSKHLGPSYIRVINSNSFPSLSQDGAPYMADNHHVTPYGADLIVAKISTNPTARRFLSEENRGVAQK